ncbi:hypothetical protein GCM10009101_02020 [Brevundimonas lenta]
MFICLIVGVVIAAIWYFSRGKGNRPNLLAVLAVPVGCIAMPIVGVVLVGGLLFVVGTLVQKSDEALAEEVFGHPTTLTGDRMLFDDFGRGRDREIYMRAEMTAAEREELLSIAGAVESEYALISFAARGDRKGFTWWVSTAPGDINYCESARITDAHGFNGWTEFRIAECRDAGVASPLSSNGYVYVVASGRRD